MKYQFLTATVLSVLAGGAIAASDFIDTAQNGQTLDGLIDIK